jgi:hypothetical protein
MIVSQVFGLVYFTVGGALSGGICQDTWHGV